MADNIPFVDICRETSRHVIIAAGTEETYQGHPTTVLLPDNKTMFCIWPIGHGGSCGPFARSMDAGLTWMRIDHLLPAAVKNLRGCPMIYRIAASDGKERLWLFFSRNEPQVFRFMSEDHGNTWQEMPPLPFKSIMTFSSIVRLKGGTYLGLYHKGFKGEDRSPLRIMQSLTEDGGITWSDPRMVAEVAGKDPCEPYVFRSPDGQELCCIMRENKRTGCSLKMFSRDEGKTWSIPEDAPRSLTGDRHQGIQTPDGRLAIAFRDTEKDSPTHGHFVAWVGTYDDIRNGREGQYRIKLLHSYAYYVFDCGYPGVEILPDGTIIATTYIKYQPGMEKHSVVSVRVKLSETDGILQNMLETPSPATMFFEKLSSRKTYECELTDIINRKHMDVNAKNADGWTPLHEMSLRGNMPAVKLLLQKGADINAKGRTNWTPVHMAISGRHESIARLLIDKGADINIQNECGQNPIHMAFSKNFRDLVAIMVQKDAQVNAADEKGWTLLHWAVYKGCIDIAKKLLGKGADINAKGEVGRKPISLAISSSTHSLELVNLLIESGADIEEKDGTPFSTPIYLAALNRPHIVKLLIQKGVDVNTRVDNGETPLHRAAFAGNMEIASMLLEKGADVNARSNEGKTPLHKALWEEQTGMVEFLKKHGAVE